MGDLREQASAKEQQSTDENQGEEQQQEQAPIEKVNVHEVNARKKGWVSRDEWGENGKDVEDWMSAKNYNEKGDLINRSRQQREREREFDQRITDNNAFWKAQLDREREKLVDERLESVELADVNAVKKKDKEIEELDKQKQLLASQAPKVNPADVAAENTWFDTNRTMLAGSQAKLLLVQNVYDTYSKQGYSGSDLIGIIDKALQKEFPPVNANRQKEGKTDGGGRSNQPVGDLTVDSLTADDKAQLDAMRRVSTKYASKTDTQMLKILKDARK